MTGTSVPVMARRPRCPLSRPPPSAQGSHVAGAVVAPATGRPPPTGGSRTPATGAMADCEPSQATPSRGEAGRMTDAEAPDEDGGGPVDPEAPPVPHSAVTEY